MSRGGGVTVAPVRFVFEVEVPDAWGEAAGDELSRLLRYWAGAVRRMDLQPGTGSDLYDSEYRKVGSWRLTER
jgi:hypothetical protein